MRDGLTAQAREVFPLYSAPIRRHIGAMARSASSKPLKTSRGVSMGMNEPAPRLPQAQRGKAARPEPQQIEAAMKRFLAPVGSDA